MIPLGGQAPHVLRAHMWALNTCGEPNEIELTAAHGFFYGSFAGKFVAAFASTNLGDVSPNTKGTWA